MRLANKPALRAKVLVLRFSGFKDTEKDMLEKVKKKLLVGPNIDNNNSYN